MATNNNPFVAKNGLAVGSSIDVIDSSGNWIGASGALHGATGVQGASGYVGSDGATGIQGLTGASGVDGATGPLQYITYGNIDMGTILSPANISIDLGTF